MSDAVDGFNDVEGITLGERVLALETLLELALAVAMPNLDGFRAGLDVLADSLEPDGSLEVEGARRAFAQAKLIVARAQSFAMTDEDDDASAQPEA